MCAIVRHRDNLVALKRVHRDELVCCAVAEADGKDDEKAAQQCRAEPEAGPAMYGCPVCRKDHILDLDRLQVSWCMHFSVLSLVKEER